MNNALNESTELETYQLHNGWFIITLAALSRGGFTSQKSTGRVLSVGAILK